MQRSEMQRRQAGREVRWWWRGGEVSSVDGGVAWCAARNKDADANDAMGGQVFYVERLPGGG